MKEEKKPEGLEKPEGENENTAITELKEIVKKQSKDISLLTSIADKKKLALYYQRNKEDLPTVVNVRKIDGKIVQGWRNVKNDVYQDAVSKKWIEDQRSQILFIDGTTTEMSVLDFYRKYVLVPCTRIGILNDEVTKETAFKLKNQENDEEYTIGVQFVN